jgi:KaiC/GvpD/RAD55 family RecA-like ATPase
MNLVKEFIEALAIEIEALKKGKGGGNVTLYNGGLFNQLLDSFLYEFSLESILIAIDDTPAILEVNGREYDCDIISVIGQKVQVSTRQNLGERVPLAKLKTNTWYLLDRLKTKFEENLTTQHKFVRSEMLFQGQKDPIDGGGFFPSYSIKKGEEPNSSQHKAIESSINESLSIIWGPPGTGKTATIAQAIESHLNEGRKVLLLSHSNNAVDQALIKVAKQTAKSYYLEGKLVRLGLPKSDMLDKIQKEWPLVLLEEIAEAKSAELTKERESLLAKLNEIISARKSSEEVVEQKKQLEVMEQMVAKQKTEIDQRKRQRDSLRLEVEQFEIQKAVLEEKLEQAKQAGFLKRTFRGLDPEKISRELNTVRFALDRKSKEFGAADLHVKMLSLDLSEYSEQARIKNLGIQSLLKMKGKTISQILADLQVYDKVQKETQERLSEVNKKIEDIRAGILGDASLVATTLTKSYLSKEIENVDFDILIVDEVSMAPLPMLYWAASKVRKGITIVGDFLQLPPICISDDPMAQKWLGKNIFEVLDIDEIPKAEKRVQLLDTQYRMHPEIARIPNERIYGGRLKNGPNVANEIFFDDISGDSPVCVVDTSPHNPWASQLESGGRFNLINAMIAVSLAEIASDSSAFDKGKDSIGIVTPYRYQAQLISKIAEDRGLSKGIKLSVNTVHSFQGGEESIIIFDSVEGVGAKRWSMINEFDNTDSAKRLLNVAITRAKKKVYFIVNRSYLASAFPRNSLFAEIIEALSSEGKGVKSTKILPSVKDERFDYWIEKLSGMDGRPEGPESISTGYGSDEFWPSFHNDLSRAKDELIIFSPFLTVDRMGKLQFMFADLLRRGVKIHVITKPLSKQSPPMREGAKKVIHKLHELDINVKFRYGMHEKIALIDRKIKWIGSLNILSHNAAQEYMERADGEKSTLELFERFNLEEVLADPMAGNICPGCQEGFIEIKKARNSNKHFYGCSEHPSCNFTAPLGNTRPRDGGKKPPEGKTTSEDGKKNSSSSPKNWETKLAYWSSGPLPGYRYSAKKDAWWKGK